MFWLFCPDEIRQIRRRVPSNARHPLQFRLNQLQGYFNVNDWSVTGGSR
jgi:hypothetical protein